MFPGTGFHAQLNRLGKNLVFKHPFLYDTSLKKGIQESTKAPRHQEIISNFWKFRLRCSKHFLKIKKWEGKYMQVNYFLLFLFFGKKKD